MKFLSWITGSGGPQKDDLEKKIAALTAKARYKPFPDDINKLDDSYRALIRELAKR